MKSSESNKVSLEDRVGNLEQKVNELCKSFSHNKENSDPNAFYIADGFSFLNNDDNDFINKNDGDLTNDNVSDNENDSTNANANDNDNDNDNDDKAESDGKKTKQKAKISKTLKNTQNDRKKSKGRSRSVDSNLSGSIGSRYPFSLVHQKELFRVMCPNRTTDPNSDKIELTYKNFPNIMSEFPHWNKSFFSLMCASYFNGIVIYDKMNSFASANDLKLLKRTIEENTKKINDHLQENNHQHNNSTNQQVSNFQQQVESIRTGFQQQIESICTDLQQINTKHDELLRQISNINNNIERMCSGINLIFTNVRQAIPEKLIEINQNDHNQ